MNKGDIVLISFPFTDLNGSKLRPSVVLIDSVQDIIVCFITTQLAWQEKSDLVLNPLPTNGLKKTSLIRTNKFATLDKSLSKGLIGKMNQKEIELLNEKLKSILQL
jgi:mRNA interferase MazF